MKKKNNTSFFKKKNQQKQANTINHNIVPYEFHPYLIDLNPYMSKTKQINVLGRDEEINRIYNQLLKFTKKNAVLLGPHGVGKTAIMNKLVFNIVHNHCPKFMYNYHVLYLDVEALLANIEFKSTPKKLSRILDFVTKYTNIIVFIDKIHLMQCELQLSYTLARMIANPNTKVIGCSTYDEFYDYFQFDNSTRAHMSIIPIEEPKPEKIHSMLKAKIKYLENVYKIQISKRIIEYIMSVSGAIITELVNPELTLDLIENSMIIAKRNHKKEVDRQSVNVNFNFRYDEFEKISEDDKKITAYHEAGHFVTMYKLGKYIKNQHTTAITIVPSEWWLGVTLFELEYEKQTCLNIEYYTANMAVDLGGRLAENLLYKLKNGKEAKNENYSSGASNDLQKVTRTARNIVMKFGMIENCSENMVYDTEYDEEINLTNLFLLSEEIRNKIDISTKDLIKKAQEMGKEVLEKNADLVIRIAEGLLKNDILDEGDLMKICNDIKKQQEY